jgi:glycerophosphoryl diester phosphodiesterase
MTLASVSGPPTRSRPERPLVIAHRGAKAYRPENTLAAYALAVEQNADMIEIDLHLSCDRSIPIRHDAGLADLGAESEIRQLTLAQLRNIAKEYHESLKNPGVFEQIPILDEVLDHFGDVLPFNLEIKTSRDGIPYPGLEQMVLDQVISRGLLAQTLFSSFSDRVLSELRDRSSDVRLGVLVDPRAPENILERAGAVGAEAINPHHVLAKSELVDSAHSEGLAVFVYTVDEPAQMRSLFEIGVDGIFSNYPDRLREVVDSL